MLWRPIIGSVGRYPEAGTRGFARGERKDGGNAAPERNQSYALSVGYAVIDSCLAFLKQT